jgi:uncharacterized membrane protein YfcA
MLIKPSAVAPAVGAPIRSVKENPSTWFILFFAGVYGGFVQAGVGFILLAALAGGMRYDLVRANALKLAITASLTIIALIVFVIRDQVLWIPGLVLAIGTVLGASLSVRFAIHMPQSVLKFVLFAMVLVTCVVAYFN